MVEQAEMVVVVVILEGLPGEGIEEDGGAAFLEEQGAGEVRGYGDIGKFVGVLDGCVERVI